MICRGAIGDHVIKVREDLSLDLVSEAQTVEEDRSRHRGSEPRLCHTHSVLLHVGEDGGADPLLARALQHQAPAPDAVLPEQVDILHLETNRAFTWQRKFPHKLLEVDKGPSTQESAVTVIVLKMSGVRLRY